MINHNIYKGPSHFSSSLWEGDSSPGRSSWLTPLYVERFAGPRKSKTPTAHGFWEFICIFRGDGHLLCEENRSIHPFDIVLVPPGISHCEDSESTMDTVWIGFNGQAVENCNIAKPVSANSEELSALVEKFWFITQRKPRLAGPVFDARILDVFVLFLKTLQDGASPTDDKIEASVKYINDHFSESFSISDLAFKFDYSEGHFYRLFKKRVGFSPVDYLTSVRMKQAMNWLQHTDVPIAKVAINSGFPDQAYFSRIFRKNTGTSPGLYRNSFLQGQSKGKKKDTKVG
ncbi:MAG: AraC family transcriptional regulator [Victivallales bacterium]